MGRKLEGDADASPDAPSLPMKVRLIRPHGYFDENGRHRAWTMGDVVSDPAEVELLMNRSAPIEIVE